jgi:hypothetical protein
LEHPERIFDAVRSVIDRLGVLKARTRRALDSTLLDDAVATQDTATQLIAAIRRVCRLVPGARDVTLSVHDYETSGKPLIAWDDPVAKAALIHGLVNDTLKLLVEFEGVAEEAEATSALGLLAMVAGQDVEQQDDGTWQIVRTWSLTGSFLWSIPKPATCISPVRSIGTGSRPTSPSSPRRVS